MKKDFSTEEKSQMKSSSSVLNLNRFDHRRNKSDPITSTSLEDISKGNLNSKTNRLSFIDEQSNEQKQKTIDQLLSNHHSGTKTKKNKAWLSVIQ